MEGTELSQGPDQFSTSACVTLERLMLEIVMVDTPSCVTSSEDAFHVTVLRRKNEMEHCSIGSLVIQGPPVAPAQQCSGLSSQRQHPARALWEKPSRCTDKFLYQFILSTLCRSSGCPGSPSLYLDKHLSFSCL